MLPIGVIAAILVGWLTSVVGFGVPVFLIALSLIIPFLFLVFNQPKAGIVAFIIYGFLLFAMIRGVGNLPFSYAFEPLLIITWLGAMFHNTKHYNWSYGWNDLTILGIFWFILTVAELFNPIGGSLPSWISDARYPLMWLLLIPLCQVILNTQKDLNLFFKLIIGMSVLAALYGIKQLKIGLTPAEEAFLITSPTHVIFGKLRVFSFYSDAGQFGASMGHLCVITFILALGPFKKWKKIVLCALAVLFLYCMFISGTRGSLLTLFVGLGVLMVINKNLKIIVLSLAVAFFGFAFLKYTFIGHNIYEIRRMRSALNPNDASLNVRLVNQQKIASFINRYPFGAGVGAIGFAANSSTKKTYLTTIPTDSYWVKIWASYGIIGLVIWFSMMMYILGKCCGIVWNTHDKGLKYKLTALTAGAAGILFCSYGNEVINNMPSSMIVYISWAFVFLGPKLDRKPTTEEIHA